MREAPGGWGQNWTIRERWLAGFAAAVSFILVIVIVAVVTHTSPSANSGPLPIPASGSSSSNSQPATTASESGSAGSSPSDSAGSPEPSDSGLSGEPSSSPNDSGSSPSAVSAAPGPVGIALPVTAWTPVGGASITPRDNGVFEVTYDPTYWGGVIAHANVGCNYQLSGQGRVLAGDGYGFSVYASIDSEGTPYGQGLQYDVGAGGYKDVQLPDGSESGAVHSAVTDNNWHTITIQILNGIYTSSVDGQVIFTGDMPATCTSGLFIRLWNSTDAEFRNLSVTQLS